jgi:hypothetical protein
VVEILRILHHILHRREYLREGVLGVAVAMQSEEFSGEAVEVE